MKKAQDDLKKQIEQQEMAKENQNDQFDYKKAFELLMCAMVMKTLAPSMEQSYGSPDLCIKCMERGLNFVYGDNGEKRLVCDKCPYNITTYKGRDNS